MSRPLFSLTSLASVSFITGVSLVGLVALVSREAGAQVQGSVPSYVKLQGSTPGQQQAGHAHLSGTVIAGQFKGDGAQVTNVNAGLLDGLDSTAFLQSVPSPLNLTGSNATAVVSGTNSSTTHYSAGVKGASTGASGITNGGEFTSVSPDGRGVHGWAQSSTGVSIGGMFESSSSAGIGVFAASSGTIGIKASSYATSGTTYGGYFQSFSPLGTAVYGVSTGGTAAQFVNQGGGLGLSVSVDSGARAVLAGNYGTGDYGMGGEFTTEARLGTGVLGTAWSSNPGANTGGAFFAYGTNGVGVNATAFATGVNDTPYGLRGTASAATLGYGVYAAGDLGASGVKSFRIDHPRDPANKYLLHYSSESPFPQNFYCGTVTTDSQGYAWVQLPDYFGDINTNFKYQLTVIGKTFSRAIVSEEVQNNRFQIRTEAPNLKVSWEVKADRNDRRVQLNRPTDVRLKNSIEQDHYDHPEYYGLGREHAISGTLDQEVMAAKDKRKVRKP